ncbi:MAG: AmmeMemoRadiSam system protein B [Promethearchaeota archaeon]
MGIRKAYHAGTWYKGNEENLKQQLEELFLNNEFGPGKLPVCQNQKQRTIIGGVSPHAGFAYSGCSAAHTYFNLFKEKIPDTIIILGNHHQPYSKVGIMLVLCKLRNTERSIILKFNYHSLNTVPVIMIQKLFQ